MQGGCTSRSSEALGRYDGAIKHQSVCIDGLVYRRDSVHKCWGVHRPAYPLGKKFGSGKAVKIRWMLEERDELLNN